MQKYDGFVLRKVDDPDQGNIVIGAVVKIKLKSTGLLADIFSDEAGTVPLDNPLISNSDGKYSFYAANGAYIIDVNDGSSTLDIQLLSAADITSEIEEAIDAHVAESNPHTQYAQTDDLADVATSGSYTDLSDKPNAAAVVYTNTVSGLSATNTQAAIDEVLSISLVGALR